jgi:hypothetical protein
MHQRLNHHLLAVSLVVALLLGLMSLPATAGGTEPSAVRFASFNASLNRFNEGDLAAELAVPGSAQPDTVAEIIQRTRPDVLLVNEFDYDAAGVAAQGFQDNYLSVPHGTADPIDYPYRLPVPSNTGVLAPVDIDGSGSISLPGDGYGFGFFPGQFAFVVFSMYPIVEDEVRTFQNFLWRDMPGALLPDDPSTPEEGDFYPPEVLGVFRLSSKNHADIPIRIGRKTTHFLTSHPTPPVFDDPVVDQNGRRNHDEIRLWADYVRPSRGRYLVDDDGRRGGLEPGRPFVIAGDQNADPFDGDSVPGAAQQLLEHPLVNTRATPDSEGGPEQADLQGGANDTHIGDPAYDTADFNDSAPGNLRVDYVLPRKQLRITDAGVFWPTTDDPLFSLVGTFPFPSSDHRLVWVDVRVPGA